MKVVVGLGNPGDQYLGTRHNVGFDVLSELANRHQAQRPKRRFEADVCELMLGSEKVLLFAPMTYMNLSGRAVQQVVKFFQLVPEDLLVVCDDLNLKFGQLRIRAEGTAGGQKGLANIIQALGTQAVPRLRVGIGRPATGGDVVNFVLAKFAKSEVEAMEQAVRIAANGVEQWIQHGLASAMNMINGPEPVLKAKPTPPPATE